MTRNFLTLEDARREDLRAILDLARTHAAGNGDRPLAGKTVCLAFFEASTRTAVSFELAARRCGADVINAGDGCGQHPTQALLDLYALGEAVGGFDELVGRRVAVVGDILHSRVARSVIPAFLAAGVEVALVAPRTLLPQDAGVWDLPVLSSVDEALLWGAGVLYALRLQRERMTGARVPSISEYARFYGVAGRHLRGGVLVMHPGPVNRGVEISGDVVLDGHSLIPDQVAAGIHVRSAVLALAAGTAHEVAA